MLRHEVKIGWACYRRVRDCERAKERRNTPQVVARRSVALLAAAEKKHEHQEKLIKTQESAQLIHYHYTSVAWQHVIKL